MIDVFSGVDCCWSCSKACWTRGCSECVVDGSTGRLAAVGLNEALPGEFRTGLGPSAGMGPSAGLGLSAGSRSVTDPEVGRPRGWDGTTCGVGIQTFIAEIVHAVLSEATELNSTRSGHLPDAPQVYYDQHVERLLLHCTNRVSVKLRAA